MEIKVCGLTEEANIREVLAAGIDYIGLIFYPLSKRCLQPDFLRNSFLQETRSIRKVGVFVNEDAARVLAYAKQYKLDVVQLHGNESPDYCRQLSMQMQVWKAFQIDTAFDFSRQADYAPYCHRFLFDAPGAGYGGTGYAFDWSLLDGRDISLPFMLSGGISPGDAEKLKKIRHPAFKGIDLNSRFEVTPGLKNINLLNEFIYAIRN